MRKTAIKRTAKRPAAKSSIPSPATAGPERTPAEVARARHGFVLPGAVYRHQVTAVVGDDPEMLASAQNYVVALLGEFGPRDAVERMLVAQMVHTHARVQYLSAFATGQDNLKWAAMMHEAADRAANTFRRQLLALAEYRRPPRPARPFTASAQANIAGQQVVQNGKIETATNGQGCPPALPADAGGTGGPAAVGRPDQAVAAQHRPADGGRQGGGQP